MSVEPLMSAISGWGGTFAPRQWTFCAGQLLAVSQFSAIFSLVGTVYGGDGRTNFRLPDLRGRVPIGAGQSPGTSFYQQGQLTGEESVSLTALEMPAHNHSVQQNLAATIPASAAEATSGTPDETLSPAMIAQRGQSSLPNIYGPPDGTTFLSPGSVSGTITTGQAGGNQPFGIVQPLQAIQFIFALEGVYPSRN